MSLITVQLSAISGMQLGNSGSNWSGQFHFTWIMCPVLCSRKSQSAPGLKCSILFFWELLNYWVHLLITTKSCISSTHWLVGLMWFLQWTSICCVCRRLRWHCVCHLSTDGVSLAPLYRRALMVSCVSIIKKVCTWLLKTLIKLHIYRLQCTLWTQVRSGHFGPRSEMSENISDPGPKCLGTLWIHILKETINNVLYVTVSIFSVQKLLVNRCAVIQVWIQGSRPTIRTFDNNLYYVVE